MKIFVFSNLSYWPQQLLKIERVHYVETST